MTETQEERQGAVVERSLAFAVRGETATIKQSGVGVVATTGATDVRQSMAASVLSGGGVSLSQGAATAVVAAGDVASPLRPMIAPRHQKKETSLR